MSSDLEILERNLPQMLRERRGRLTSDLVQDPAAFGLGNVPSRLQPDAITTAVCGYCSTGCGLTIHLRAGQAINLTADPHYPVNLGMACPKGWEALTPLSASDRATTPLLRNADGKFEPVDWDEALQMFTLKFKAFMDKHGPESVAFLSTGQICSEEMLFLGALFKFGMGGIHCDSNTRQCMATSHVAYKQSFGFDAPPFAYTDFEESDAIILVGSNLCVAHPIMWQRVLRNKRNPEIIVVDPRRTETAEAATQHLQIKPKSDLTLFYGTARALIERQAYNRDYIDQHTAAFEDFAKFVEDYPLEKVLSATGLSAAAFERFVETIATKRAVSFWWTMGVNQGHESTRTAQAIINLALMTGNMGRPGTGANSVTGQCNAMGSRIFANITGLPGGRDFQNPQHRDEVARLLGIPLENIPAQNSLPYHQILERIDSGAIKGLWVIATNPAHSWIGQKQFQEVLKKLEFLVVQDLYATTETAQQAHLVLPAAGWGEKEGTFINSERRFGLSKKVSRAPGQALADFHIFRLVAHYWGCAPLFREWSSPQAVFQIMKRLSAGRPCDITGIEDYRHLDAAGGIQWPCLAGEQVQTSRRLFEDGRFYHPDGKARFIFEAPRPLPEDVSRDYPFTLLTGRGTTAEWHTGTRTSKSDILRQLAPSELHVEMNPQDARRIGVDSHSIIRLASLRGHLEARVMVSASIPSGQLFLPMHSALTNRLTLPAFDPYSHQPAYKFAAVRVEKLKAKR